MTQTPLLAIRLSNNVQLTHPPNNPFRQHFRWLPGPVPEWAKSRVWAARPGPPGKPRSGPGWPGVYFICWRRPDVCVPARERTAKQCIKITETSPKTPLKMTVKHPKTGKQWYKNDPKVTPKRAQKCPVLFYKICSRLRFDYCFTFGDHPPTQKERKRN